jgi:pimeloyl-ACP methyl ester carboxylesterase
MVPPVSYEHFDFRGHRLAYRVFGDGPKTTVLLPGLLLPQKMQWPLAEQLAQGGNRVVTLDPLGHGASDRPDDMRQYSMTLFGEQTVALLDHLALDSAVVGGTSLGANITLEVAALAPERLRGMIVEMPVLDHALVGSAVAFSPMLVGFTLGRRPLGLVAAALRRIPRRGLPNLAEVGLDWVSQAPGPSGAALQGLFFGRIAPPQALRRTFEAPTLVIGHERDPIHPFSDAADLAKELPNGRLVHAHSFFELRVSPERLTGEIREFIDECWKPELAPRRVRRAKAS